jgi:Fuc2NAc and GlcNAc transferase
MDGIDGFAGSQAVIIFATVALLSMYTGNKSIGNVAAIFAAASVGFLIWNWPPAKIFLGDVGSGGIGYLVCGLAIASENQKSVPLFVFAILGLVFIADSTATLIRRFRRGSRTIEAHRDHAYQRLAKLFGSHKPVTVAAAGATSVLALLGTIATLTPRFLPMAFIAACVFVALLLYATEKRAPLEKRKPV